MAKKWAEVGEQQFRFTEVGDTLEGELLTKGQSSLDTGLYRILPTDERGIVVVLGSMGLDKLLAEVAEGSMIKIELNDIVSTRQGTRFKDYRVYVEDVS